MIQDAFENFFSFHVEEQQLDEQESNREFGLRRLQQDVDAI